MERHKFRVQSILFMIVVMIVLGAIFSFKRNITNKESPKKATLVNTIITGDLIYE